MHEKCMSHATTAVGVAHHGPTSSLFRSSFSCFMSTRPNYFQMKAKKNKNNKTAAGVRVHEETVSVRVLDISACTTTVVQQSSHQISARFSYHSATSPLD